MLSHSALVLAQPFADKFEFPKNGMIRFRQNDFYGYLNEIGEIIIEAVYKDATDFTESGVAFVSTDEGWMKIDRNGKLLNLSASAVREQPADIVARLFKRTTQNGK